MARSFVAHWLGRVRYADAHALQERLLDARSRGAIGDTLLLLEHDPVVTLGRSAREANILLSRERLGELGALPISGNATQFAAMLASETERWRRIVEQSGATKN